VRVERANVIEIASVAAKRAEPSPPGKRDEVTLSDVARSAAASESDQVSDATIERLRHEVASGKYTVDSDRLAQRMLDVEPGWGE
jgi:flagellar biosynthesis anti-sigma factor FlgM